MKICPRCQYARKESDIAPDSECPSCGVAYAKSSGIFQASDRSRKTRVTAIARSEDVSVFFTKFILILLALALLVGGYHRWSKKREAALSGKSIPCKIGQPEVMLYSTTDCGYCRLVKKFMYDHRICYTEKVTDLDGQALVEYHQMKGLGVPLLIIGEQRLDGFNQEWMEEQLKPWL